MGCAAKVIVLDDIRASQQRQALRQQLHAHFDRWLDEIAAAFPESEPPLAQVSETIWRLRQTRTAGVAQTLVEHMHAAEQRRESLRCATCERLLRARPAVSRTAQTMIGDSEVPRPYFYGPHGHRGRYPLDAVLGLSAGRMPLDVPQAAVDLATAWPSETAATLCGHLSGLTVSSERMPTFTNRAAEGLSVLAVAPSRDAIEQRVAQVATGRCRRPVVVLGIAGAYVPSRPESARGRRPGHAHQRARRAQWRHEWRAAKGWRFYLLDGERIVPVLSWPQVPTDDDLGEALQQVKEAGVIPEDTVRLCVLGDGAEWRWKHGQALFPPAGQGLDDDHCSEYLHKVATAQYSAPLQAVEWVEATLTRLSMGKVGWVLGGLRRRQPTAEEALKAMDHCWVYLTDHRGRTH
jgi:hypothetical protein